MRALTFAPPLPTASHLAAPHLAAPHLAASLLAASLLGASLLATASWADPPGFPIPAHGLSGSVMSPGAFDAYSTGKTLAYVQDGVIWGRETYLPGRHVLWRAVGEDCKAGHWWDDGAAVCFSYDDGNTAQCWAFATGPSGLTATFLNEPGSPPAAVQEEADPMPCPGPEIGS